MVLFVIPVSTLLCLQSLDCVSGQYQACTDAEQALFSNSECQQAFLSFDVSTNTGSGSLCTGTCRNLLVGVRDNCESQAVCHCMLQIYPRIYRHSCMQMLC